ncbi:MAG: CHAP domain-containing protein [Acetobacteraceae bacterium]|nr:CHAP domain-containing protein [Acetobacteraceae bacterium]
MGNPLDPDGEVGLLTWGALGGEVPASVVIPGGSLGELAVGEAIARVGVREKPPGSNRGPEVQAYLGSVGVAPGNPWCMAFVSFCIQEAAKKSGKISTFPRTGGCLDAWNKVKAAHPMNLVTRAAAMANVAKVVPGMVFVLDLGDGHGHTGFVKANHGGSLITVEGNSNATGGSDGVGVFELNRRGVMDRVMKGFIAVP